MTIAARLRRLKARRDRLDRRIMREQVALWRLRQAARQEARRAD